MTRFLHIVLLLTVSMTGCEREIPDKPPPLRPLVYTEAPPADEDVVEVEESGPTWIAPEDLGIAVYQALVEHDRELFEHVFITGPELTALIRTPEEKAAKQAAELLGESDEVWSLFLPSEPSEEPVGGLAGRLKLLEFKVGKGRDLAGKLATPGTDEVVQHWGSDLRLQIRGTEKTFALRVPKIVKTENGWRVAAPLEVDPTLRIYLESGMHLKPELLTSEHYPYPLEVGNYWKYRIKGARPRVVAPPEEEEPEEELAPDDQGPNQAVTPSEANPTLDEPSVRISVVEVLRRDGYLVTTLEEEITLTERNTERSHFLVTPRRVYPCTRDCKQNIDNIGYLLGYMAQQTPVFIFPLQAGRGWGKAGRAEDNNRYDVREELERADVPAGDFANAFVIAGSIGEGFEQRYFVPGTGVVLRKVRSGVGPRTEELIEFRLML